MEDKKETKNYQMLDEPVEQDVITLFKAISNSARI